MRLQNSMCWENGNFFCCWTSTVLVRALGCAGCSSTRPVGAGSEGTGSWEWWEEAVACTQNRGGCLQPFILSSSLLIIATWSCSAAWLGQWIGFWMDNTGIPACLQLGPCRTLKSSGVRIPPANS